MGAALHLAAAAEGGERSRGEEEEIGVPISTELLDYFSRNIARQSSFRTNSLGALAYLHGFTTCLLSCGLHCTNRRQYSLSYESLVLLQIRIPYHDVS